MSTELIICLQSLLRNSSLYENIYLFNIIFLTRCQKLRICQCDLTSPTIILFVLLLIFILCVNIRFCWFVFYTLGFFAEAIRWSRIAALNYAASLWPSTRKIKSYWNTNRKSMVGNFTDISSRSVSNTPLQLQTRGADIYCPRIWGDVVLKSPCISFSAASMRKSCNKSVILCIRRNVEEVEAASL